MSQDNVEHAVTQIANTAVQISTAGLVSYDQSTGQFGQGVQARAVNEAVGEVSGRNVQRKAAMDAADALRAEADARNKQLADEQARKRQQDINASQAAEGIRASAEAQQNIALGASNGIVKDFLGL